MDRLLMETGDTLLLESGDAILLGTASIVTPRFPILTLAGLTANEQCDSSRGSQSVYHPRADGSDASIGRTQCDRRPAGTDDADRHDAGRIRCGARRRD